MLETILAVAAAIRVLVGHSVILGSQRILPVAARLKMWKMGFLS
jgi:hypothetical protein